MGVENPQMATFLDDCWSILVRFGSPDLRSGALGVKKGRGTVSPYSRGEFRPKTADFSQNRENMLALPPLVVIYF